MRRKKVSSCVNYRWVREAVNVRETRDSGQRERERERDREKNTAGEKTKMPYERKMCCEREEKAIEGNEREEQAGGSFC